MDEVTRQALCSALRSVLISLGSILTAKGVIDETTLQALVGAIMVLAPAIWGIWDKAHQEKATRAREAIAVQVGVTVANRVVGYTELPHADTVPELIATVAPKLPQVETP